MSIVIKEKNPIQDLLQNLLYKNTEENHLSDCMIMKKNKVDWYFPQLSQHFYLLRQQGEGRSLKDKAGATNNPALTLAVGER